jgi:hypothetical protein
MLTVDSIMRGPKLVGSAPTNVRWSKDSSKVYFSWQKPDETRASTWTVNRDGAALRKLTDVEARTPDVPVAGRFDRARRRAISENGDMRCMTSRPARRDVDQNRGQRGAVGARHGRDVRAGTAPAPVARPGPSERGESNTVSRRRSCN